MAILHKIYIKKNVQNIGKLSLKFEINKNENQI